MLIKKDTHQGIKFEVLYNRELLYYCIVYLPSGTKQKSGYINSTGPYNMAKWLIDGVIK